MEHRAPGQGRSVVRNFAVEPINNDDLDDERLRWRGRDDSWHYAAQFHVFPFLRRRKAAACR